MTELTEVGREPSLDVERVRSDQNRRVREIRIAGSDTSVVIGITTAFPSGPIGLTFGGQAGTLTLDGDLAGHQQFSISRGAILDGTIKGSTKMHVTTAMFGSKGIDMLTETESSIVLLPDQ